METNSMYLMFCGIMPLEEFQRESEIRRSFRWHFHRKEMAAEILYIAVPAVTVLALIYYLYQREFFFSAALSALGLLGIKVAAQAESSPLLGYGYLAVLAVLVLAGAVCFRLLQSHKGFWSVKGKAKEILPKNANYAMLYVTCILVAAVVIAALVLGALAVLYGVLVAWLLILAVYYTVRLM